MKTRNNVQLIGYLGNDPIIRQCKDGTRMAALRLATHHPGSKANAGDETKWHSTWHNITVWGNAFADEIAGNYLKGSHIMVEGNLRYKTYKDKNGHTRYITDIHATKIYCLDR